MWRRCSETLFAWQASNNTFIFATREGRFFLRPYSLFVIELENEEVSISIGDCAGECSDVDQVCGDVAGEFDSGVGAAGDLS